MTDPLIAAIGVGKRFNGVRVLGDVDFAVEPGQVHGLVGENGAGKSTLMKLLSGVYPVEDGRIEVRGVPTRFDSPAAAQAAGIGMVFQEFSLVGTMSVAQNVMLRNEPRTALGFIDDRAVMQRSREVMEQMGVEIDVTALMGAFGPAIWQLTEIAKWVARDVGVLILDEPTASLTRTESDLLFALISRLTAAGIGIVYISHRMEEILQVCDRVTVLRDGALVLTAEVDQLTVETMVAAIVGEGSSATLHRRRAAAVELGPVLLELEQLRAPGVHGIDLSVRAGEVVGVAGLVGSGRTELLDAVFGLSRATSGRIAVGGETVSISRPSDAIRAGIALIPEDRRRQGLVLAHDVRSNLLLTLLRRFTRAGWIDDRAATEAAFGMASALSIKAPSITAPIATLSGGNQQKAVIGKWLGTDPRVLLLDEPTAGIDIGAKGEIVDIVRGVAADGGAVVLVSSDIPELLAVADRIIVLRDGGISHDLDRDAIDDDLHLQRILQGADAA